MDPRYRILKTLFEIAKADIRPISYPCKPRDIILRHMEDWNYIHSQLISLEAEKLISIRQIDTLVVFITEEGIEKVRQIDSVKQS